MSTAPDEPSHGAHGTRVHLRGHEVVSHTLRSGQGRSRCVVFLFNPYDGRHNLMVFKAYGERPSLAERAALEQALVFLEGSGPAGGAVAAHGGTIQVAGRIVEIFCDLVGHERYQAFPFLQGADGTRRLIMQFHLKEAVTARSPAEAMTRCIARLREYFAALDAAEPKVMRIGGC